MLNETALKVFDATMSFLTAGEYVVIDKTELKNVLPDALTQAEINSAMSALQTNELIKIRYSDTEVFCVAVLPKGVLLNEKRKEEQREIRAIAEKLSQDVDNRIEKAEDDEKEIVEKPVEQTVVHSVSMRKIALIAGLSSFFGALIAGLVMLAVILAKLG